MSEIEIIKHEAIDEVLINRPEAKNALNRNIVKLLGDYFRTVKEDKSVKCIIFSGKGTDAFCAGADLKELASLSSDNERLEMFSAVASLIEAIGRCEKPVIAKVCGYAVAGGFGLVAASDIVIASDDSKFGLPEIKLGIIPAIISAPLSRAIGRKALAELMLTGDLIDAKRAFELQLISKIVRKSEINNEVFNLAKKISSFSQPALKEAKELLLTVTDYKYFDSLPLLAKKVSSLAGSSEAKTLISSFTKGK